LSALTEAECAPPRRLTGIAELDRLCGGFVPDSAILVGAILDRSLLPKQAAAIASSHPILRRPASAAYITGEEAIDQVRLRGERLGVAKSPVLLAAASSVRDILASLDREDAPGLVVVDSIQTMYLDTLDSSPER